MRKLNILKTLVDIFFFFGIISALTMVIIVPFLLVGDEGIPIRIKGQEITDFGLATKILMVVTMFGALCFVYAIYLFRRTIGFFTQRQIFHPDVVLNLSKTGVYIVASALLTNIPLFIYNVIHRQNFALEFGAGGFDSLLLSVSLGLFFMVLSEVFKIAGKMKEENELTV